jgi:hypothetical protein
MTMPLRVPFLLPGVAAICLAQAPQGPPRLVPDRLSHDFGQLAPGTRATHRFLLRNAGGAPLTIAKVVPSCGCTSSVVGKTLLAPGESTALDVTFDTTGLRGPAQKSVQVLSDDPANPSLALAFQAEVLAEVLAATDLVRFQDLGPKDRRKASVKLVSTTGQAIHVTDVELSPAPWLGVATREDGEGLWVDLDLLAKRLPPGQRSGTDSIALHLVNPGPSVVQLKVHWIRR